MVAYAAVSAAVGTVLLVAPKEPAALGSQPPVVTYVDSPGPPAGQAPALSDPRRAPGPSRVAMPVPAGYQRTTGPNGLVTAIPAGWVVSKSSGPAAMQATDPADPNRFVRYGGALAPATGLLESHVDYDRAFSATRPGFRRLSLGTTTYHDTLAVDWEFEHEVPGSVRTHAHSMYWRVNGIEYFIYAAAPAARWAETAPIYDTLVSQTTP
ncbi:hypothetical protein UO65_1273 [Actinokineospora spheciospongiae]|uniref:Uncharacterized protein n=1 Tax=Actinokineospora spheciospongiae TaxID=909613 RepID=W7J2T8_9PSEU|nr:hypothetical protein [Actinokineospora spheciospongiae]EWC63387.1 hypothetical protein UO65_1273 [Actinokineospora spheciospongiae]PWW55519.1 hypothetical protein DFQ13_112173 [Actinokineospora spheciospongiae]